MSTSEKAFNTKFWQLEPIKVGIIAFYFCTTQCERPCRADQDRNCQLNPFCKTGWLGWPIPRQEQNIFILASEKV